MRCPHLGSCSKQKWPANGKLSKNSTLTPDGEGLAALAAGVSKQGM